MDEGTVENGVDGHGGGFATWEIVFVYYEPVAITLKHWRWIIKSINVDENK